MKKILLVIAILSLFSVTVFSQGNKEFSKGNHVLGLGAGAGSRSIPVTLSYELCIIDGIAKNGSIGIGGIAGFRTTIWGTKSSSLLFGFRAAFHYNFVENLDTYAGIVTAYSHYTTTDLIDPSIFAPGAFVGARYYLGPVFAVKAEAGYGISNINVGFALRF